MPNIDSIKESYTEVLDRRHHEPIVTDKDYLLHQLAGLHERLIEFSKNEVCSSIRVEAADQAKGVEYAYKTVSRHFELGFRCSCKSHSLQEPTK